MNNPLKSGEALIEINHVTFGYDERRAILNDVSLRFARRGNGGAGQLWLRRDHAAATDCWRARHRRGAGAFRR